jgi:hypothetical protein
MATAVFKENINAKAIDWINPTVNSDVTLENYHKEMKEAESSGFISFEVHKKNMNEWLAKKLQQ